MNRGTTNNTQCPNRAAICVCETYYTEKVRRSFQHNIFEKVLENFIYSEFTEWFLRAGAGEEVGKANNGACKVGTAEGINGCRLDYMNVGNLSQFLTSQLNLNLISGRKSEDTGLTGEIVSMHSLFCFLLLNPIENYKEKPSNPS